jgi:hypothetical protein
MRLMSVATIAWRLGLDSCPTRRFFRRRNQDMIALTHQILAEMYEGYAAMTS